MAQDHEANKPSNLQKVKEFIFGKDERFVEVLNLKIEKSKLENSVLSRVLKDDHKFKVDEIKVGIELVKQEYTEVCLNNRHYSNMRFAIFTVCFAIFGGLVSLIYDSKFLVKNDPFLQDKLKLGGLFISIIFFLFEWYCSGYLLVFIKRAKELESLLGYKQFTKREERKRFRANILANCPIWIYISLILFWFWQLYWAAKPILDTIPKCT